jgi:hypothetical protein
VPAYPLKPPWLSGPVSPLEVVFGPGVKIVDDDGSWTFDGKPEVYPPSHKRPRCVSFATDTCVHWLTRLAQRALSEILRIKAPQVRRFGRKHDGSDAHTGGYGGRREAGSEREGAGREISDCEPSEGRAENKQNLWIIGIWVLFLEALSLGRQSDITVGGTFTARSVKAREESLHSKEAVASIQEAVDAEAVLFGPGLPEAFKQHSRFPI